ncbi:MAG TPA: hypothetical protein VFG68_23450 [Fimbriiglobus sp.]|nr:hypothetical protein [Fimbriiglobus sp.]
MKLYRAMIPDADGLPQLGRSARQFGVRLLDRFPNNDVDAASEADTLQPGKGVSVAPDDPAYLAKNRRPPQVNGGIGKDPVWVIDTNDLGPDLFFLRDKPTHGVIGPTRLMTLAEYEFALAGVRSKWVRYIG